MACLLLVLVCSALALTALGDVVCSGNFYNPSAAQFASCTNITGTLTFSLSLATTIDQASLLSIKGDFSVSGNSNLGLIELDALVLAGSVEISSNDVLQSIVLPQLERSGGNFIVRDNIGLISLFLPALANVDGVFAISSTSLSSLRVPSLTFVLGSGSLSSVGFQIYDNAQLASVVIPAFDSYSQGAFQICQNGNAFLIPANFESVWKGQSCSVADGSAACPSTFTPCVLPNPNTTTTAGPQNCIPTAQTACIFSRTESKLDCSGLSMTLPPCTLPTGTLFLDFSGNSLASIEPGMFYGSGYSTVVNISLTNNPIASIQTNSFTVTTALMLLNIDSSTVQTSIASQSFAGLNKKAVVNLSGTSISTVASDAFGILTTYLGANGQVCQSNACGGVCGGSSVCYVFEVLSPSTSFTCVGQCIPFAQSGCNALSGTTLNCASKGLKLIPCTIATITWTLQLDSNSISYLSSAQFIGAGYVYVRTLTITSNPITMIAPSTFAAMNSNLLTIYLSSLSSSLVLQPNAFGGLASECDVLLQNSRISNYATTSFGSMTSFYCGTSSSMCHPEACTKACGQNAVCIVNGVLYPDTALICATNCDANALLVCDYSNDDDDGSVDCSNRGLTQLPCALPSGTTVLNYDGNSVGSVPAGVLSNPGFAGLAVLSLKSNRLTSAVLNGLTSATFVDLSFNQIPSTNQVSVAGAPLLQTLDLSNNPIVTVPPNVFEGVAASLSLLSLTNIQNITIGPLGFAGLSTNTTVSLIGTIVYSIASYTFPTDIPTFECGQSTPGNCSTTACEAQCGPNSVCYAQSYLTPTTQFTCGDVIAFDEMQLE